ncbi:hypothetical protein BSLG_001266 [Batrachochytrium salamandrivorans]|nr:hypothetical protein BSLG_001266 [Batrachochytrium salamandrivorans]
MQAIHDYEDEENSEVVLAAVSPTVCTSARWVPAVAGSKLKADSIIFATEPVSAWSATDRIHHAPGSERGQERHLVAQIFILSKEQPNSSSFGSLVETLAICHVYRLSEQMLYTETCSLLSEDEVREWTSVVLSNLAVHNVYVTGIDPAGQSVGVVTFSLKLHKNIMAYELEIGSIQSGRWAACVQTTLVRGLPLLGLLLPVSTTAQNKAVLELASSTNGLDGFPANVIFGADRAEINAPVGLYV